MPRVESVCIGETRGARKRPVESAVFRAGHGIEGDAHAGPWHRQITILAAQDIEEARKAGLPQVAAGAFAENVVVSGLDLGALGLGTRLRLGSEVVLAITQIGKVCHTACEIGRATGDCIMPRRGLFARVEQGGTVRPADEAAVTSLVPRDWFQAVVLTISDRCSRGEAEDTAGPAVARRLETGLGAHVYAAAVVPDDVPLIAERLRHYADGHSIDLIVTVGGTGFAPRDVTPEATRAVVERPAPGLDEAMRAASLAKTPHAVLSRGASGIRRSTLILNLPGSERAAVENLDAVLKSLPHGLAKLRGDPSECGAAGLASGDRSARTEGPGGAARGG
jgi:molybdenum cofactor synthesis domain-containing protein